MQRNKWGSVTKLDQKIIEKAHENNVPLYLTFIRFKNVADSVSHPIVWTVLRKMDISCTVIKLLKNLYSQQHATIRVEDKMAEDVMR